MKKFRLHPFAAVTLGAMLTLSGYTLGAASPVERVSEKLNAGGCCYSVYDCTKMPSQMDFLLARVRPAAAEVLEKSGISCTFDEDVATMRKVCKTVGLDRIEALGESSIVIHGSAENLPYFFHNRVVVDTGSGAELPPFLILFAGDSVSLEEFAAAIPESAVGAVSFPLDWGSTYRWINAQWQIPTEVTGAIQTYTGCPPEEFFSGISGRCHAVSLDNNPMRPVGMIVMSDKENRVYNLIAKTMMLDATKAELDVAVPESLRSNGKDFGEIKVVKGENTLTLYIGIGAKDRIAQELAAGKTFNKRADFSQLTARMPAKATGYSITDYSNMNPLGADAAGTDNSKYLEFSAVEVSPQGMVGYQNGYTDAEMALVKAIFAVIPQIKPWLEQFDNAFDEALEPELVPDSEENRLKCTLNLSCLGELYQKYGKNHNGKYPEALGLTGLKELLKEADEKFQPQYLVCPIDPSTEVAADLHNLKWINTSYVYFGVLPDTIPADARPVISEYPMPKLGHENYSFNILFADGHTEFLSIPETVDDLEKLMSYLHTQKHYSEENLKVLLERGKALEQQIEKELTEEWEEREGIVK